MRIELLLNWLDEFLLIPDLLDWSFMRLSLTLSIIISDDVF